MKKIEEPLLGHHSRRSNSHLIPALYHMPRDGDEIHLSCESPSSLKEKLIFGSPDDPDFQDEGYCSSPFLNHLIHAAMRHEKEMAAHRTMLSRSSMEGGVKELDVECRNGAVENLGLEPRDTFEDEIGKANDDVLVEVEQDENKVAACGTLTHGRRSFHRSKTAPALTILDNRTKQDLGLQKPLLVSSMTVAQQACIGLALYLVIGILIYIWMKDQFSGSPTHVLVDAVYFCIVTMCTIGYGDITPTTPFAKLLSCAFVLVGFGFIDILLSGMVNFVLDRQETLLLSAATAGQHERTRNYLVDIKKGRMRIRMKVALAFGVVVLCIGVGAAVMRVLENLSWIDAIYLSCMSVTTVGYGDHAFNTLYIYIYIYTLPGRAFASVWLLVSTLAVARSFLYLAEARIDKRHRLIAKWVLEKEMTVGDLVAADLDNDGCVSKSDFIVYKLKQIGKVEQKVITEISEQFNRLDTQNSGKIRLSYLLNLHATQNSVAQNVN